MVTKSSREDLETQLAYERQINKKYKTSIQDYSNTIEYLRRENRVLKKLNFMYERLFQLQNKRGQ